MGFCGSIVRAATFMGMPGRGVVNPEAATLQFCALSVLLNTPPGVPAAYTLPEFRGSMATNFTGTGDKPEFTALQLAASSMVLKAHPHTSPRIEFLHCGDQ